jgi:glycosyltransferase involved in cell wall biosynthesis
MAMLESMAMEVPVIVTDIGGLREAIVPGETGELVKPAAPAELAEALRRCIGDRHGLRAKGIRARERVRELFSREAMTHATAQLLDEVARTSTS